MSSSLYPGPLAPDSEALPLNISIVVKLFKAYSYKTAWKYSWARNRVLMTWTFLTWTKNTFTQHLTATRCNVNQIIRVYLTRISITILQSFFFQHFEQSVKLLYLSITLWSCTKCTSGSRRNRRPQLLIARQVKMFNAQYDKNAPTPHFLLLDSFALLKNNQITLYQQQVACTKHNNSNKIPNSVVKHNIGCLKIKS